LAQETTKNDRPTWLQRFKRIPSFGRLAVVSLTATSIGCASLAGGMTYIKQVVPRAAASEKGTDPISVWKNVGQLAFLPGMNRMNILLLGIDYNHDEKGIIYTKGARSDTMMLVSLSNKAEFMNAVSIPRDTRILISEKIGYEKINAAYSYGGVNGSMETVSQFLGVPVHHYVVIKVHGAKKMLDAIGGLPIDVEKDMDYDDNWGHLHIHLKKGPQVLTGEQAVGYARFRKDEEGDRGRMRRQQQVIRALIDRLKSPTVAMSIPALAQAVKDTLETDLSIAEMADLARLYGSFDHKQMKAGQVTGEDEYIDGVAMIIPHLMENQKLVRRLLKDRDTISVKDLRIQILNGSGQPGVAQKLADLLEAEGMVVANVDLAKRSDIAKTEINDHSKVVRMRTRLQQALPDASYIETPEGDSEYDVVITVGNDACAKRIMDALIPTTSTANREPEPSPAPRQPSVYDTPPARQDAPVPERRPEPAPVSRPSNEQEDPALRVNAAMPPEQPPSNPSTPAPAPAPVNHPPAPSVEPAPQEVPMVAPTPVSGVR
jgi:LCP family protein required for cell wall assembly